MAKLPEQFLDRMKEQLGDEYEAFLASYEKESYAGLRVNTGKLTVEKFQTLVPFALRPIPWTGKGFYIEKTEQATKHPYYYAGLYYIQEPSAMLPASRLPVQPGDRVLDLCAAPGGKATELASRLEGRGLLVANDVSASRAKALLKNLTMWGCTNFCVTAETPEKLLARFGCFFDKILVDAPCSGEGMFRKDSGLISGWLERGPKEYAVLQKQILDCALAMLRPGGMLLYSTCTFAKEEDEDVIADALMRHPDLELVQAEGADGLSAGYPPCEKALRVWPHHAEGEGHFLALLHKTGKAPAAASKKMHTVRNEKLPQEVRDFLQKLPEQLWKGRAFRQVDDQCLLLPEGVDLPDGLRYLRTGLLLGTCKKERFEPSQALAMALSARSYPDTLDLLADDPRILRYLKGETIEHTEDEPLKKGWVLICVDGMALGWAKYAGGVLKNKYYPGWRMQ